jgi:LmbE family N-acetylglucosaminyl deacetylase
MPELTLSPPRSVSTLRLFFILLVESILFLFIRFLPPVPAAVLELILAPFWLCTIAACLLGLFVAFRPKDWIKANGEDILIIASHPDDCVAIAGGYAIQTAALGGKVNVVYTTGGAEDDPETRRFEAKDAWGVIGIQPEAIHFLPHRNLFAFQTLREIQSGIAEITDQIKAAHPGTIFVPLYEGGNYQHDATNYMAVRAAQAAGFSGRIWESPEYNFYFSLRATPEKILCALTRAIPLVKGTYPPEPIRPDGVYHLSMNRSELETKSKMLARFKTQNPDQLVVRFGFEDRYQALHRYAYTMPPFRYEGSLACLLERRKSNPILGKAVVKMVKWTRTIHPDPAVLITRLPLETAEDH